MLGNWLQSKACWLCYQIYTVGDITETYWERDGYIMSFFRIGKMSEGGKGTPQ